MSLTVKYLQLICIKFFLYILIKRNHGSCLEIQAMFEQGLTT